MIVPMMPGNSSSCSGFVTYSDVIFPQIGCTKKFARTWEVIEWWCGVEETTIAAQIIDLIDDQAPEITCPPAFTITTNDDCAGNIILPGIEATDACGNGVNVSIEHPWGIVEVEPGVESRATLETGKHSLRYKASDDCHNETSCITTVTIQLSLIHI